MGLNVGVAILIYLHILRINYDLAFTLPTHEIRTLAQKESDQQLEQLIFT